MPILRTWDGPAGMPSERSNMPSGSGPPRKRLGRPPGSKNKKGRLSQNPIAELEALTGPSSPRNDDAGALSQNATELEAMAGVLLGDRDEPRAVRFRKSIRELMNRPDMMKLIEDRVRNELTNKVDVKIFPTVARVAAGDAREVAAPVKASKVPAHMIRDMWTWSSQELKHYAQTGEKPGRRTIDITPGNGGTEVAS